MAVVKLDAAAIIAVATERGYVPDCLWPHARSHLADGGRDFMANLRTLACGIAVVLAAAKQLASQT